MLSLHRTHTATQSSTDYDEINTNITSLDQLCYDFFCERGDFASMSHGYVYCGMVVVSATSVLGNVHFDRFPCDPESNVVSQRPSAPSTDSDQDGGALYCFFPRSRQMSKQCASCRHEFCPDTKTTRVFDSSRSYRDARTCLQLELGMRFRGVWKDVNVFPLGPIPAAETIVERSLCLRPTQQDRRRMMVLRPSCSSPHVIKNHLTFPSRLGGYVCMRIPIFSTTRI